MTIKEIADLETITGTADFSKKCLVFNEGGIADLFDGE